MGAEAIQTAIHVVLPSLRSTCDKVNYLNERALLSSSFVVGFFLWGAISSFKRITNAI